MSEATRLRWLTAAMAAGFLTLAVDVWFEHRDVVREFWYAWIPIVDGLVLTLVLALTAAVWSAGWRSLSRWLLVLNLVVGGAGFFFHNAERIFGVELQGNRPAAEAQEQGVPRTVMPPQPPAAAPRTPLSPSPTAQAPRPQAPAGERRRGNWLTSRRPLVPPLLAPFSFAGLALFGLLALWRAGAPLARPVT